MRTLQAWRRLVPLSILLLGAFAVATLAPAAVTGKRIRVDPNNPHWLDHADGTGFIGCGAGDPENFLYRGTRQADGTRVGSDQTTIMADLAADGGNLHYWIIWQLPDAQTRDTEQSNPNCTPHDAWDNCHTPLTCSESAIKACDDDSDCSGTCAVNPDIIAQWSSWLDTVDANDHVAQIYFFDDLEANCPAAFDCDDGIITAPEAAFIEAIVNGLEDHDGIIWVVAEEHTERMSLEENLAWAAYIKQTDDWDHPVLLHNVVPQGGSLLDIASQISNEPSVDGWSAQFNNDFAPAFNSDFNSLWDTSEAAAFKWGAGFSEIPSAGTGTGLNMRQKAWSSTMGGSWGFAVLGWYSDQCTQGCNGTFSCCPLPGGPPLSDQQTCSDMIHFFSQIDHTGTEPDNGRTTGASDYALVDDVSNTYIAYTDNYSASMGVTLVPAGTYDAQWLDEIGNTTTLTLVHGGGSVQISKPGVISGDEVALSLSPSSDLPSIAGNSWAQIAEGDSSRYTFPTFSHENSVAVLGGDDIPQVRAFAGIHSGPGHLFYFGGGHDGYPGNDVEQYDVLTSLWTQSYQPEICLNAPGACGDPDVECACLYGGNGTDAITPNVRPYTEHTYDYCAWDPLNGKFFCILESGTWHYDISTLDWTLLTTTYPGEPTGTGNRMLLNWDYSINTPTGTFRSVEFTGDSTTYEWDPVALTWASVGTGAPDGSSFNLHSTYDPVRQVHYVKCQTGCGGGSTCFGWGSDFWEYNAVADTWTPMSAPVGAQSIFDFDYDTDNDVLVGITYAGSWATWVYDPVAVSWAAQAAPGIGPPPTNENSTATSCGSHSPNFQYDPISGYFWYASSATLSTQDPTARLDLWAYNYAGAPAGDVCGDGAITGPEACDTLGLGVFPGNNDTCAEAYGAGSEGTLVCNSCTSVGVNSCGPLTGETFTSACGRASTVSCWDFEDAIGDGIYGAEEDIYYTKGGGGLDVECDAVIAGFNPNGNSNGRNPLGDSLGMALTWGTSSGNVKGTCTGDGTTRCWTDPDCSGVGGTCTKVCTYQRRDNSTAAGGDYSWQSIQPSYSKAGADGETRFEFRRHGVCSILGSDCYTDSDCPGTETCDGPYTYARFGAGGEVWVRWKMKINEALANPLHADMPFARDAGGNNNTGTKLFMISGITSSGDGEHTLMHVDWSGIYHMMSNSGNQPFPSSGGEAIIGCPRSGTANCGDATCPASLRDDPGDSHPACSTVNDLQDPCWVDQAPCRNLWELGEVWRTYQAHFILPTQTQVCYDNDGVAGIPCTTDAECVGAGQGSCQWCSDGTLEVFLDDETSPIIAVTDNQYTVGASCSNLQPTPYEENTTWIIDGVEGLGRLWTTFFMTNKDPEYDHADGIAWYDSIIVSHERVPFLTEAGSEGPGLGGSNMRGGSARGTIK